MTDTTETVRKEISYPFKEIRIVSFSGNMDDCPKWSKKFMAAAKVKKFANIIDRSMTVSSFSEIMQTKDISIRDLGQAAYCCLLHCMEDDVSFALVDTARSENLPDGDVVLAWKNLLSRYEPKQYGTLLELKRSFMAKSLQECENNPDTLYLELKKS